MPIKEGGLSRKVFVVCNSIFLFLMIFILTRIQFALEDKVVHYQ